MNSSLGLRTRKSHRPATRRPREAWAMQATVDVGPLAPHGGSRGRCQRVREDVFVCTTVLLETEWVSRSVYDYEAGQIVTALRAFAGLPRVAIEAPALTAQALDWVGGGMDFADAPHLAQAAGCEGFISFDRRFAKAANKLGAIKVRVP